MRTLLPAFLALRTGAESSVQVTNFLSSHKVLRRGGLQVSPGDRLLDLAQVVTECTGVVTQLPEGEWKPGHPATAIPPCPAAPESH